jgi:hypothetical protein
MTDGQITNRDLYEAQRDTERQVGSLALQVATLVAEWRAVGERLDAGSVKMADYEQRLRALEVALPDRLETRVTALEKMAWKLTGAFAGVNVVALVAEWLIRK